MFDLNVLPQLKQIIINRAQADNRLLETLRRDVRSFSKEIRQIHPRSTTAVSLVASDGGNNKLAFDPFYFQLVRVTDSYGKELCLDAISPSTDTDELSLMQFYPDGTPKTALGKMMMDLNVDHLSKLSTMIPRGSVIRENPENVKPKWVQIYRDLCEWAVLYERIVYESFATDTLIVRDGQLRSYIFAGDLFIKWRKNVEEAIDEIFKKERRKIYLVGIAKKSKVIDKYRLAMVLENVFPSGEPRYIRIPRNIEAKAYIWKISAREAEIEDEGGKFPKYIAGDMFFVRFGKKSGDPIWAIDIFSTQSDSAAEIFGFLLNDALNGFPIPFYPLCLQKAHEHAHIVDFDLQIFQDEIFLAVRNLLPKGKREMIDSWKLNSDLLDKRYE
jgi:NurA domain